MGKKRIAYGGLIGKPGGLLEDLRIYGSIILKCNVNKQA
jgi:hypothetical protein